MDTQSLTITSLTQALLSKKVSSVELTRSFLQEIKAQDKDIHAFLEVTEAQALQQAQSIDEKIARKESLPPLAGVPCALKDAIFLEGARTTAGSKMLEHYVAPYDATVVAKLKEAGAVI